MNKELIEAKEDCLRAMKDIEEQFKQPNFTKRDLVRYMRREYHRLSGIPHNNRTKEEWKRLNRIEAYKEIQKIYSINTRLLRELDGTAKAKRSIYTLEQMIPSMQ